MRPAAVSLLLALAGAVGTVSASELSEAQRRRLTPIVEVVRANKSAVVNISATQIVTVRDLGFGRVPFFDLFDTPHGRQMKTNSVGSGAVIHPAGYVLTNAHVVAQASELKVIFADGSELPAEVVASLNEEDLAVLRVHPPGGRRLPSVRLGRSDDLMVGETVIAIGNPLGLQHSVTTGIISAVGRELPLSPEVTFRDIVQTDAAINPGNSGGPLLNVLGELIGVNTAIRGDAQNVGFAIPVDRVRALLPDLLGVETRGRVRLGIGWGSEVRRDENAGAAGVPVAGGSIVGVTVARVESGTPAAAARLAPGTIVTEIGGEPVRGVMDALVAMLHQPVGRPFPLKVVEGGVTREVRLAIEELPLPDGEALALARFGLRLREVDVQLGRRLGLRAGSGLQVTEVVKGSSAARAGIEAGDLITQVGRYGVRDIATLGLLLEKVSEGDAVHFSVVRIRGPTLFRSGVTLRAR